MKSLRYVGLLLAILTASFAGIAHATDDRTSALPVQINDGTTCTAFRYVVDTSADFLVLCRYQIIPEQAPAPLLDGTTAPISAGALVDTLDVVFTSGDSNNFVTTNRVLRTATALSTDLGIIADGTTDITSDCTLALDLQTIACEGTGLSDATHSLVITYRSGWNAYDSTDVFFQVFDGSTAEANTIAPSTGYGLVAIYLSAAQFTATGITWGAGTVTVKLSGNPALWTTPSTSTKSITWDTAVNHTQTQTNLQVYLRMELHRVGLESGAGYYHYASITGITDAGQELTLAAAPQIVQSIPTAFLTTAFNAAVDFTDGSRTYTDDIQADAAATSTGIAFGGTTNIVSNLISLLVACIAAFFTNRFTAKLAVRGNFGVAGCASLSVTVGWVMLVIGGFIGSMSFVWMGVGAFLILAGAGMWAAKEVVFD